MWRHVAPVLARDHTVVLADLRGYGDSGKPVPDAAGNLYSKRFMARDQVGLMRQLGFGQFQLVGHDRGARVAHRLALDHPGTVTRLAVLDIVPTRHVLGNVTRAMATAYYHWFFLTAPNGIPEHMIAADPSYWVRSFIISPLLGEGASIEPEVMEDYVRCFGDPGTIAGSCGDYRAGASTDLVLDEETFASGQRIECPVLVLWGEQAFVGRGYEPLSVWQQYATDVRGHALPTGHFLPEEAPDLVSAALRKFLD
jgi:haloacetate dehalogenase